VTAVLAAGSGPAVVVAVVASVAALAPAGLRWLRVAQREHYLPEASRFALRWWTAEPANLALALIGLAGLVASARWPLAALVPAAVAALGPLHLGIRGRSARLAFTRRLRTLAVVWLVLQAVVVVAGVLLGAAAPLAGAGALAVPLLVDLAALALAPVERRLAERYVRAAAARLARVRPRVVAITGSYGKTSTKHHLAHLLSGSRAVVASPASFNNRAGLARAVNEHLVDGTEIFVAEMGTYGPGEIAELCRWCPPEVAVMTAIGPVHLERFGTEDRIVTAKREITGPAAVVVLNGDDPRLAPLAPGLAAEGKQVVAVSAADDAAAVAVVPDGPGTVRLARAGRTVAAGLPLEPGLRPSNVACAVAAALALGLGEEEVVARLPGLAPVANRLTRGRAPSGVTVLDDTFNSNPAGARAALDLLAGSAPGRRVVVTPGMVELGRRQRAENEALAAESRAAGAELVVVGRTNRRALLAGAAGQAVTVRTREEAVRWVRAQLGPDDAVLYENDLPDHYP
jgi:UDP-N-acetylmuramoyl-tripeptide--D-alanyl-D-alanine ligase